MIHYRDFMAMVEKTTSPQDPDIKKREGTQPKKYYAKDAEGDEMSKSTKEKRARHFEKGASKSEDDPTAYKPAPGDKSAKTKPSKYTQKMKQMYPELYEESKADASLKKKSEKSGVSVGILRQVYNRGVAAWRTGHRPGTTPEQWGHARVNSFLTGGKTRTTADADLWKKHKGKSESVELEEVLKQVTKDGEKIWAVVSKEDPSKVLQYYKGEGKPSKEWFDKVERRVQYFKNMKEEKDMSHCDCDNPKGFSCKSHCKAKGEISRTGGKYEGEKVKSKKYGGPA